jgi:hypothetical protein
MLFFFSAYKTKHFMKNRDRAPITTKGSDDDRIMKKSAMGFGRRRCYSPSVREDLLLDDVLPPFCLRLRRLRSPDTVLAPPTARTAGSACVSSDDCATATAGSAAQWCLPLIWSGDDTADDGNGAPPTAFGATEGFGCGVAMDGSVKRLPVEDATAVPNWLIRSPRISLHASGEVHFELRFCDAGGGVAPPPPIRNESPRCEEAPNIASSGDSPSAFSNRRRWAVGVALPDGVQSSMLLL